MVVKDRRCLEETESGEKQRRGGEEGGNWQQCSRNECETWYEPYSDPGESWSNESEEGCACVSF